MPTREQLLETGLLDAIADLEFIGTYSREPAIRQLADSAVDVAKQYMEDGMNFSQVLVDLEELQSDRIDALKDAAKALERAEQRLDYATLSADMRTWTQEEREEYDSACYAANEAFQAYLKAKEAL